MPQPPDTGGYLLLGLAAVAVLMLLLIGSMIIRYRNLRKDEALIRDLEDDQR